MLKNLIVDAYFHLRECFTISGAVLVLILAGLFCLKLSGKKSHPALKTVFIMVFVSLLALVIPVSAAILRMITGVYYDSQDMWNILPIIPFGAFTCALFIGTLFDRKDEFNKQAVILALIFTSCAVIICGSLGKKYSGSATGPEEISVSEKEASEFVLQDMGLKDEDVIFASDEITAYLHICSGKAVTFYGRDMWDGRLTKNRFGTYTDEIRQLHDDMKKLCSGKYDLAPSLCEKAFRLGAKVCIFPGECASVLFPEKGEGISSSFSAEEFISSDGSAFIIVVNNTSGS